MYLRNVVWCFLSLSNEIVCQNLPRNTLVEDLMYQKMIGDYSFTSCRDSRRLGFHGRIGYKQRSELSLISSFH